ncbi:SCAN domain-containing protein 3-like [Osmia bicornis bicornis]|uniref:SCAN domain-containing protein 3-like n=1 Tax=Osmia bicornis bicornis TaxID=1437191 RepID=UPI001EAEED5A|nr:SCAN domain-containing protein 3-like [Osmia bicornis bicornis]
MMKFGFTSTEINGEERPQCVLCMKVLAAECMLPSKLKRHLESNHHSMVGKPRDFFARKLKELKQHKNTFFKTASIANNALLASYKVAYRIAKCKKPHTIAEELILPAAVDMVTIMVGESAGKMLLKVPLSNNTISRRIQYMVEDINYQLIEKIKGVEFGLQLDEATDNNKDAHLICYVRFIDGNNITEDLLFCKSITAGAKAQDLFEIFDTFISENNLNWSKCVGVCTDGARSMSGCYGGLQALIRSKSPNALWTYCIIHREALASKHPSPALNQVLECMVNVLIATRRLQQESIGNVMAGKTPPMPKSFRMLANRAYCTGSLMPQRHDVGRTTERVVNETDAILHEFEKDRTTSISECQPEHGT